MADPLKRLGLATTHYSIASLFALVSGLITFPLFTRIFSVEDYGVMSLIGTTLSVSVTLGKLGVQQSIVRYQSEISAGKSKYSLGELYSTTFFGMTATGFITMIGVIIFTQVAPARWVGSDSRVRGLFAIAALLIIVQVSESAFTNLLRAEQRTSALMKYNVIKKYLTLGLTITAVLLTRKLTGFYGAQVVAEAIAGLGLFYLLFNAQETKPRTAQFSRPLYRELLGFGIPMMIGYELAGTILAFGDRYVIEGMLGAAPLGLYGAAYNLCQYIQAVIIASVGQAIMPLYMELYDRKGAKEAADFIAQSIRTYVLFGAPVVGGLAAVGPELLPSLASDKYASASSILPWVIGGMVIDGMTSLVGAGLYINRKTKTLSAMVLGCATLNIVLNFILVPRLGILGSAVATLISYLVTAVSFGIAGRSYLRVPVPWTTIARAGIVAALMYLLLFWIYPGHRMVTVALRIAIGGPFYVALMSMIDPDARVIVNKALGRFRRRAKAK